MRETIVKLEKVVEKKQNNGNSHGNSRYQRDYGYEDRQYVLQLEESINKFEKLLTEKDSERHGLIS